MARTGSTRRRSSAGKRDAPVEGRFGTVIVSTDFSEVGDGALPFALRLARDHAAPLRLIHVLEAHPLPSPLYAHYYPIPTPAQQRRAERAARKLLEARVPRDADRAQRISLVVSHGDPATEILGVASGSDAPLIVIASHGRTGLSRLALGSVAEKIVRAAPCPVLVVRRD